MSPDQVGVLAQQGPWRDDQPQVAELPAGQQQGQRDQGRPVGPGQGQPGSFDLTLEYGDLMPQEQDLGVLSAVRAGEPGQPAEHPEGAR